MSKIKHIIKRKDKSPEIYKAELQEHSNKAEAPGIHSDRHSFHIPAFFSRISAAITKARENVRRKKEEKRAAAARQKNEPPKMMEMAADSGKRGNFFQKLGAMFRGKKEGDSHGKADSLKNAPRIDFFKKQAQKLEQRRQTALHRKQNLKIYLEKAGIDLEPGKLTRIIFNFAIIVNLGLSAYLIYHFSTTWGITWGTIAAAMAAVWVLIFIVLILLLWVFFYFMLDLRIFKRKGKEEEGEKACGSDWQS